MKFSQKHIIIAALLSIGLTVSAGTALARGPMGYNGHGGHMGYNGNGGHGYNHYATQLTPEQQAVVQQLYAQHRTAVEPIHQQLIEKKAALDAEMVKTAPDAKVIEKLSQEIGAIHGKLLASKAELNAQLTSKGIPVQRHWKMHRGNGYRSGGNGFCNKM